MSVHEVVEIEVDEEELFRADAEIEYKPWTVPDHVRLALRAAEDAIGKLKLELMSVLAESMTILRRAKLKRNGDVP